MQVTNWADLLYSKRKQSSSSFDCVPDVVACPDSQCDARVIALKALRCSELKCQEIDDLGTDQDDIFATHFIATGKGELLGGARLILPQGLYLAPLVRANVDAILSLQLRGSLVAQIDMYVTVKTLRRRSDDEIEGVSRRKSSLLQVEQGILSRNYLLLLNILKKMFVLAKSKGMYCLVYRMSLAMQETFDALSIPFRKWDRESEFHQSALCFIFIDEVFVHFSQSKTAMAMWFLMR